MNKLSHSVLWIVTVLVTACNIQPKQEPIEEVIDRGLRIQSDPVNEKICRNVHRPCRRGKTHHLQP